MFKAAVIASPSFLQSTIEERLVFAGIKTDGPVDLACAVRQWAAGPEDGQQTGAVILAVDVPELSALGSVKAGTLPASEFTDAARHSRVEIVLWVRGALEESQRRAIRAEGYDVVLDTERHGDLEFEVGRILRGRRAMDTLDRERLALKRQVSLLESELVAAARGDHSAQPLTMGAGVQEGQTRQRIPPRRTRRGTIRRPGPESGPAYGLKDSRECSPKNGVTTPPWTIDESTPIDVSHYERSLYLRAIAACDGSRTRAARLLAIPRSTFYRRLSLHGISTSA